MKHEFSWRDLRAEYRQEQAPESIRRQVFPVQSSLQGQFWKLAWVAAALAVAIGLSLMQSPEPKPTARINQPSAPAIGASKPVPSAQARNEAKTFQAQAPARKLLKKRVSGTSRRVVPGEAVTNFVAFPGAEALPDPTEATLVRVRVPQVELRNLGFEFRNRQSDFVQADFVVGQDGLARAVRLVD
jgi:hypothetical protein